MSEGRVKWYREKRGYGFIKTDKDGGVFFHRSGIKAHGHFGLRKHDPVTFKIVRTPKGLRAIRVKPS